MKRQIPLFIIIVAALTAGNRTSNNFLDVTFLMNAATRLAEVGVIALFISLVISTGEIDLSVGSNTVLTASIVAILGAKGLPTVLILPLCLIFGGTLGLINGWLITFLKAPSFLVTVGTLALYRGASQALLGPNSIKFPIHASESPTLIGVPIQLWILLSLAIGISALLSRRMFGRHILAIGENAEAAKYSGIDRDQILIRTFLLCGIGCGLAAFFMGSRFGLVRHELGKGYELDAITMVVIGGTLIRGGNANVFGTMQAFALVVVLRAAMGIANLAAELQMVAMGILLLFAVMLNQSALISRFVGKRGAKSNS
jgi:rhamnose transport system permease protein